MVPFSYNEFQNAFGSTVCNLHSFPEIYSYAYRTLLIPTHFHQSSFLVFIHFIISLFLHMNFRIEMFDSTNVVLFLLTSIMYINWPSDICHLYGIMSSYPSMWCVLPLVQTSFLVFRSVGKFLYRGHIKKKMLVLEFFSLLYVAILNWCFLPLYILTSYFTETIDFYKLISFTGTSLNLFVYSNCSGISLWAKIAVLYHIRKVFMHFYFECLLFKIKNDCWILTNVYFRIYGGDGFTFV